MESGGGEEIEGDQGLIIGLSPALALVLSSARAMYRYSSIRVSDNKSRGEGSDEGAATTVITPVLYHCRIHLNSLRNPSATRILRARRE